MAQIINILNHQLKNFTINFGPQSFITNKKYQIGFAVICYSLFGIGIFKSFQFEFAFVSLVSILLFGVVLFYLLKVVAFLKNLNIFTKEVAFFSIFIY